MQKVMFKSEELGFKRHFPSIAFCSLKPRSLKNQLFFKTKCHMEGGRGGFRKEPKKCHVLFEWPLNIS